MPETKYTKLELLFEGAEGGYRMKMGLLPAGVDAAQRAPIADVSIDSEKLSGLGANIEVYAQELTSQVFAHEASRMFFAQAIMASQLTSSFLRVQLVLTEETPELHAIIWEALCDPATGKFLATTENVLISRYLESQDARMVQLRPKGEIKAAAFASNPANLEDYDLLPVDVAGELGRASQAMGGMLKWQFPGNGKFATLQNLVSASRDGADVLYLACHGAVLKTKGPVLYLENDEGRASPATGTDVVTQLSELKDLPRLIVLASCESAGKERAGALSALGPLLAASGVPAVLAMHGKISMETVKQFMPVFFSEMQRDGQIDRALGVARAAVRNNSDAWMPVLFMRSISGRLWLDADETGPTSAQMDTLINEVKTLKDRPTNALNIQGEGISISGGVNVGGTVISKDEPPVPVAVEQPAKEDQPFQLDPAKILASSSTLSPVEIKGMPRRFIHLREFTGRADEFMQFASTVINPIQERSKSIITFYGQHGIGKSWLLDRIEFECVRQQIPFSRIKFETGSSNNVIEILREIVRELGEGLFRPWTEVDHYWHSPKIDMNINASGASSNISANLSAQNTQISGGVVVGTNVNMSGTFAANTPAANQPEAAIQTLTDTFVKVLGNFVEARPVVLLFEDVDHELCSNETRRWLVETFLVKARELGGFGVLPVFTYQNRPQFEHSIEMDTLETKLTPLNRENIIEYFERRGIPASIVEREAEACLNETQGIPARVQAHSDALMLMLEDALAEARVGVPAQPVVNQVNPPEPVADSTPAQVDLEPKPEPASESEPDPAAVVPSEKPLPASDETQPETSKTTLPEIDAIPAPLESQPESESEAEASAEVLPTVLSMNKSQVAEAVAVAGQQEKSSEKEPAPEPVSAPVSRVFSADEAQGALAYQRSQEKLQKLKAEGKGSMEAMVDARLARLPSKVAEAARRASVLRWFDADTVAALMDVPVTAEALEEIISWPFVQSQGCNRFAYRQEVRGYLYASLRQEDAKLVQALHQRAHDYFREQLDGANENNEMIWAILSASQIISLREVLYHLLRIDANRGFELLELLFQGAQRLRLYGETATLIQFAKDLESTGLSEEHKNLILYWDAVQAYFEGDLETSQAKTSELSKRKPTGKLWAHGAGHQGILYARAKNLDGAIKAFELAQQAWQKLKIERESAKVGNNLGNIYMAKGDLNRAEKTFNQSLDSLKKTGIPAEQALALNNLGNLYAAREKWDKAIEAYQGSLDIKLGIGDQFGAATSFTNFGTLYQKMAKNAPSKKQPELRQKAVEYYTAGIEIFRTMGSRPNLAQSMYKLAYFYYEAGDKENAREVLPSALEIFEDLKLPDLENASKLKTLIG